MIFHLPHAAGDQVRAVVQIGHELLEIGHRRCLDLVKGCQLSPVGPQQPLKLAVELPGVSAQRLQVRLKLGQGAEHPAVGPGLQLADEIAEPVADRVEHRRLQRAGGGEHRHRVRHPGEGRLAPPRQRIQEIAPLVIAGRPVIARMVLDDIDEFPAPELIKCRREIGVLDGLQPAD